MPGVIHFMLGIFFIGRRRFMQDFEPVSESGRPFRVRGNYDSVCRRGDHNGCFR